MSVILFGATGDLGSRVAKHLHHLGAEVRCVVRKGSTARAQALLQSDSAHITEVDDLNSKSLEDACRGGSVVISTVSGLEPVAWIFRLV